MVVAGGEGGVVLLHDCLEGLLLLLLQRGAAASRLLELGPERVGGRGCGLEAAQCVARQLEGWVTSVLGRPLGCRPIVTTREQVVRVVRPQQHGRAVASEVGVAVRERVVGVVLRVHVRI